MTPRLAFADRILCKRTVDADMHVRIDAARKRQQPSGIERLIGIVGLYFRREPHYFAVLDADVETIDSRLVWADDARVFNDKIERFHF